MKLKVPGRTVEPSIDSLPSTTQPQSQGVSMGDTPDQIQLGGQPNIQDENPFEKEKFDAGVDADEESDPKRYIEQLVGKLAQKLRDYNKDEIDPSLNKFVINSIIPVSISVMDDQDAKDVIDKVKENIGKDYSSDSEVTLDNGSQELENNINDEDPQLQREDTIDGLVSELLGKNRNNKETKIINPFKAKKFK